MAAVIRPLPFKDDLHESALLYVFSAIVILSLSGSTAAKVSDLADLAPANTIAYLELHDPSRIAHELTHYQGFLSPKSGGPFRHHLRKGNKSNGEGLEFAWFCSPEFIDELGDWEGGVLALTGLTQNDEPELVGVLRRARAVCSPSLFGCFSSKVGKSTASQKWRVCPFSRSARPRSSSNRSSPNVCVSPPFNSLVVSLAEKLTLYQVALLEDAPVEEQEGKPESGVFVSLLPGAVAFGTTPDALSEAIRRYKHKSASPSLAASPSFRAAARGIAGPDCSPGAIPPAQSAHQRRPWP